MSRPSSVELSHGTSPIDSATADTRFLDPVAPYRRLSSSRRVPSMRRREISAFEALEWHRLRRAMQQRQRRTASPANTAAAAFVSPSVLPNDNNDDDDDDDSLYLLQPAPRSSFDEPRIKPCECCSGELERLMAPPPPPTRSWKMRFYHWASSLKHTVKEMIAFVFGEGGRHARTRPRNAPTYLSGRGLRQRDLRDVANEKV